MASCAVTYPIARRWVSTSTSSREQLRGELETTVGTGRGQQALLVERSDGRQRGHVERAEAGSSAS